MCSVRLYNFCIYLVMRSVTFYKLCTHSVMRSLTLCILHTHLFMCAVPLWVLCTHLRNALGKTAVCAHVSNTIRTTAALSNESSLLQYSRLVLWAKAHCVVWDTKWVFTSGVDYNLNVRQPSVLRAYKAENTAPTHNYTWQRLCLICNMFRLFCKPSSGRN